MIKYFYKGGIIKMESKIIVKSKGRLENSETFKRNTETEINKYLKEGYEVHSSNMFVEGMYLYIYVLLIKR